METRERIIIEYHKPMSGIVKVTSGDEVIMITMQEFDKLSADPGKRNKQLEKMLYGK